MRLLLLLIIALAPGGAGMLRAQQELHDGRVLLQGFYWESYRHGHPQKFPGYGDRRWYTIVREHAGELREGRFDLLWLPPPSYAGRHSAGYNPKEYFRLENSYGSFADHRALLEELLAHGIEPMADLVLNHRSGSRRWADFRNPEWGTWAITRGDECFSNPHSEVAGTPAKERGAAEEKPRGYDQGYHQGANYAYGSFRDLDHTDRRVRRDILKYLHQLRSLGYRGWRYDMVHGYHARWVALYNRESKPTFSVGKYDWNRQAGQRGWAWHTATRNNRDGREHLRTASAVFDFKTQFLLKDHKSDKARWAHPGLIGDRTDNLPWRARAVTFLENHDTGYRTHEDGTPQDGHERDSFSNNWEVEQGYAYLLTHPGIPCVYWKHYFDWGEPLRERIKALINARKVAGVTSGTAIHLQQNALSKKVYAAMLEGRHGQLFVRIGGSDEDWQPHFSYDREYREYARGTGWKVWVKLPGHPPVRRAPANDALPVPAYRDPETISIFGHSLDP